MLKTRLKAPGLLGRKFAQISTLLLLASLCWAGCRRACGPPPGEASELHPVYAAARSMVYAVGSDRAGIMGSAFLARHGAARYLVTSFHVAAKLRGIFVQDRAGARFRDLALLAVDRTNDLALLDASPLPRELSGLSVAQGAVHTSQQVFLMGFPGMGGKELRLNFSDGLVSDAQYRGASFIGREDIEYIQVTCDINQGHSGSPLLDRHGAVVGVASWRMNPEQQISGGNYAVPIRHAAALASTLSPGNHPRPRAGAGTSCTGDSDCQGLDYCIEGRCQALRGAGGACSSDEDCLLPFRCWGNACTAPAAGGEACADDLLCTQPDLCILGRCRPPSRQGDPCSLDSHCLYPTFCIAGRCMRERSVEGGPCYQQQHCRWPLGCVEGSCRATLGASCADDEDCTPLVCLGGRCRWLAGPGEACAQMDDCQVPLVCRAGRCGVLSR